MDTTAQVINVLVTASGYTTERDSLVVKCTVLVSIIRVFIVNKNCSCRIIWGSTIGYLMRLHEVFIARLSLLARSTILSQSVIPAGGICPVNITFQVWVAPPVGWSNIELFVLSHIRLVHVTWKAHI